MAAAKSRAVPLAHEEGMARKDWIDSTMGL